MKCVTVYQDICFSEILFVPTPYNFTEEMLSLRILTSSTFQKATPVATLVAKSPNSIRASEQSLTCDRRRGKPGVPRAFSITHVRVEIPSVAFCTEKLSDHMWQAFFR